jgi:hypothetical protein
VDFHATQSLFFVDAITNVSSAEEGSMASRLGSAYPHTQNGQFKFSCSHHATHTKNRKLIPSRSLTHCGNETSVVSSDFGDFGQLLQEEEHAGNRCK